MDIFTVPSVSSISRPGCFPAACPLEIACGPGELGAALRSNGVDDYLGIEIAEGPLELAHRARLRVLRADVSEPLPILSRVFDTVYALEIIEHVFVTDALLHETARVLRPGGRLIITTLNVASLGRRLLLAVGKNPVLEYSTSLHNAGHVRYFVADTLIDLCHRNGFRVVQITYDYVNFDLQGRFRSTRLARWFPGIGARLIAECRLESAV